MRTMFKKSGSLSATLALPLLLGLTVGCSGSQKTPDATPPPPPPPQQTAPETPSKPPNVTLRLDAISSSKGAFELQPGDVLRSGDRMAVNVGVDQQAYVYVAVASASGAPQVIFPKSGDQQLNAGQQVRIPANPEKWIVLDNQVGQEDVFVYASPKPIPSAELTNLVSADAAAVKKAAAKKASKPASGKAKPAKPKGDDGGALSASSRGIQVEEDEPEGATSANTNPSIVVKRFSVTHK